MTSEQPLPNRPSLLLTLVLAIALPAVQAHAESQSFAPFLDNAAVTSAASHGGSTQTQPHTGTVTHSIPIAVPPGIHGVAPQVALAYAHQSGDGVAGVGWSLSGGSITRHANYTVADTSDDYFELQFGGGRFKLIKDPEGNRYRTEVESHLHIVRMQTASSDYWEVRSKDGGLSRFGTTAQARLTSAITGKPAKWFIDESEDTLGNAVQFSYVNSPGGDVGVVYLQAITYGKSRVDFEYTHSSVGARRIFEHGLEVYRTGRMTWIKVKHADALVRSYELEHGDPIDGRLFLHKVVVHGKDGVSTLPPTTFDYFPATPQWQSDSKLKLPIVLPTGQVDEGYRFDDVDRDGRVDLVWAALAKDGATQQKVWLNKPGGWQSASISLPYAFVRPLPDSKGKDTMDRGLRVFRLDADGLADLVVAADVDNTANPDHGTIKLRAFTGTGSGFVPAKTNHALPAAIATYGKTAGADPVTGMAYGYDAGLRFLDLNGDGLEDYLVADKTSGKKLACVNDGSAFVCSGGAGSWEVPGWFTEQVKLSAQCATRPGVGRGWQILDLNGDGLPDLLHSYDEQRPGTKVQWNDVFLNNGKSFVKQPGWKMPAGVYNSKDEIVGSYACTSRLAADQGVRFADVNGDGLPDLLLGRESSSGAFKDAWLNTGSGWSKVSGWAPIAYFVTMQPGLPSATRETSFRLVDVDADGLADFVQGDNVWRNVAGGAYLLKQVKNAAGGLTTFEYQASTGFDNTGDDQLSDLSYPIWVVHKTTTDNGMKGSHAVVATTSYSYSGGLHAYADHEFRGFATATTTRPDGAKIVQQFHQDKPRQGMAFQTDAYGADGKLLQRATQDWQVVTKPGGRYEVTLAETTDETLDGKSGPPKQRKTSFQYDAYGNRTQIDYHGDTADPLDDRIAVTSYFYNEQAWVVGVPNVRELKDGGVVLRRTRLFYDHKTTGVTKGLLTRRETWLGGNAYAIEEAKFDSYGNVIETTDPKQRVSTAKYDDTHRFPVLVTNPAMHTTTFTWDPATGNVLTATDANANVRQYNYDVFGRLEREVQPFDSLAKPTTEYDYGLDGVAPEVSRVRRRVTAGKSATLDVYTLSDGFGGTVQMRSPAKKGGEQVVVNAFRDKLGRVVETSNPYYAPLASGYTDPKKSMPAVKTDYDELDRPVKVTDQLGQSSTIAYDRWLTTSLDPMGGRIDRHRDAFGNETQVVEYVDGKKLTTHYAYRKDGVLLHITDSAGNKFDFEYDPLGRLVKVLDPDSGVWEYKRDLTGNVYEQTTNGVVANMAYDKLDRLKSREVGGEATTFAYDGGTNGKLSKIETPVMTTWYAYDKRLRPQGEIRVIDGQKLETQLSYDSLDRVTSVQAGGQLVSYVYDGQGQLASVWASQDEVVASSIYNAAGQLKSRVLGNNVTTTRDYDVAMRLVKLETGKLQRFEYAYDTVGNLDEIKESLSGDLTNMGYDGLYRLKWAERVSKATPYSTAYTYNGIGNMTAMTVDGGPWTFEFAGKPVHAPSKVTLPAGTKLQAGCDFNNPPCTGKLTCHDNQCVLEQGCAFNKPVCPANHHCVGNQCVLETGCAYDSTKCPEGYVCSANECVLKEGCVPGENDCPEGMKCVSGQCFQPQGCSWDKQKCPEGEVCEEGACVKMQGCKYNKPPCPAGQVCDGKKCVSIKGCSSGGAACAFDQLCVEDVCVDDPATCVTGACGPGKQCVDGECAVQQGCLYDPSLCPASHGCVDNKCKPKEGCLYTGKCPDKMACVDNKCLVRKGCLYNSDACPIGHACNSKNKCVLLTGCKYDPSICPPTYDCIGNGCVPRTGCLYKSPPCEAPLVCSAGFCVAPGDVTPPPDSDSDASAEGDGQDAAAPRGCGCRISGDGAPLSGPLCVLLLILVVLWRVRSGVPVRPTSSRSEPRTWSTAQTGNMVHRSRVSQRPRSWLCPGWKSRRWNNAEDSLE